MELRKFTDKGLERFRRRPGRDYRHIPEPGYPNGHRHLLMGAYLVYTVYSLQRQGLLGR